MQLSCMSQRASALCRCKAVRSAARLVHVAPRQRLAQRPWQWRARAGEEASAATSSTEAEQLLSEEDNGVLSPMDVARQALQAEELDRSLLEECLAELEGQMCDLRDKLAAAEGEASKAAGLESSLTSTKDQYLRLQADFENFRKRTAAEKDELAKRAQGDVVLNLLPVLDNFELARTQVKAETEAEEKINNSYQNLYKQMVDILRSLGVEPVSTVGGPFDPELHDAIMREPSDEVPDGTVLQEFRKGFKMGERLLRPAMVKVSFSEEVADTPAAESASED